MRIGASSLGFAPLTVILTASHNEASAHGWRGAIALAALGVVYGDIGTSPLYALRECLNPEHGVPLTPDAVLGLLSLIFWALTLVVTVKYIVFVLRADHDGEGGIMALQALARQGIAGQASHPWMLRLIAGMGLTGAAMFYGDSLITPAISVLSAVEGLNVATPLFNAYVLPLTLVILVALFAAQRLGTGAVGKVFGPIMLLWFATLAWLGVQHIADDPRVLQALNPLWAAQFLASHPAQSLAVLGSVFLAVTGGEALYADMGHFGARAIRQAWFFVALPALVLNYFGQGALVLSDPTAIDNPFFRMVPAWGVIPMVILSALATVIASQAVISGAYSLTAQAMRMGYLPRLRIVQTSGQAMGQIYMPAVNWLLAIGVVALVLSFKNSSALSAAYGIAVSVTMVTTTVLAALVALRVWRWNAVLVIMGAAVLLGIDTLFLAANSLKIAEGGWLPLAVAAVVLVLFTTWARGRSLVHELAMAGRIEMRPFVQSLLADAPHRVKGTAVFLTAEPEFVPHALLHNLKHNQVMHQRNIVLQVVGVDSPRVDSAHRFDVADLGADFWQVTLRHGFMETPDVPEMMKVLSYQRGIPLETMTTTYFVSRETVATGHLKRMTLARQALFAWMHRNSSRSSDYFHLPPNRVVEFGRRPQGQ
ncbi:potassium transporter Kup [Caenimonas koreensis DSM 17982]|uniref:Probable potassium transport system protein Kup n=1 Tax=Caenimonas koreensis DSM 17982 TaxID=1121255 RepID=A0A844AU61_9BURK|nr:potassium transporter Kup [Caenimonas koreensis]MRD48030.1 potassium transporter Kup [Caenimonas koreensis DSM 17982]